MAIQHRQPPVGSRRVPLQRSLLAGLIISLAACGCASYRLGNGTLYRPDIVTVAVPVFRSDSFRRALGERLTEAVVKEIELKTPYKVVPEDRADSVLTGVILTDYKHAIVENFNDELRDIELEFNIEISWRDRRGFPLTDPHIMPVSADLVNISQAVHFVPEGGMSRESATQAAIERLAELIVARMEVPW